MREQGSGAVVFFFGRSSSGPISEAHITRRSIGVVAQLMIEELQRATFAETTIGSYVDGLKHFNQSKRAESRKWALRQSSVGGIAKTLAVLLPSGTGDNPHCLYFAANDVSWRSIAISMDNTRDGLWIINAHARTVYASEHMAEMLGTTPSEMISYPSFDYVFPEDVAAAQHLFDLKKAGDPAPFHFRLRHKDGSAIWVDVQGTPLYNAAGNFNGIVGTFTASTDQTERDNRK
jgi:PAS domain S-box-containing protein